MRRILEQINKVTEEAAAAEDEKPPAQKKQFVILVSDPDGQMPEQELAGWVLQIPEEASPRSLQERVHKAAYDFNATRRGRKLPVETNLPSGGRINVMEQRAQRRYVAHVLFVTTSNRGTFGGKPVEIIEELLPLRDTRVRLRLPRKVKTVRLVPDGGTLAFTPQADGVEFTVPEFAGHQMIELGY